MTEITRRNLAKGAAWSIPAITIAAAAPAMAASCTPTTKAISAAAVIDQVRTGTSFGNNDTNPNGDNDTTNVLTMTNTGPDALPVGTGFTITIPVVLSDKDTDPLQVHTLRSGESNDASIVLHQDDVGTVQDDGTIRYASSATVKLTRALAKDEKATFTLITRTGYIPNPYNVAVLDTAADPNDPDVLDHYIDIPSQWPTMEMIGEGSQSVVVDDCTTEIITVTIREGEKLTPNPMPTSESSGS